MFRLVVCIDVMLIKLTLSGIWGVYRLGGKKQLGKVEAGKSSGIDANHSSAAAVCKLYFHN